jgi:hypothetical protein
VGDLKILHLGQDKEILEKLQQDPNGGGNGIRDGAYLKSQPVNRVLFRDENDDDKEEEVVWTKGRSRCAFYFILFYFILFYFKNFRLLPCV